jgi:dTDP-4-amino-4,6-dideoxygalactose transaminase
LFAGLSARMTELHAAIGLRSFATLGKNLKLRREKAAYLERGLRAVEPGMIFQSVPKGVGITNYNFTVRVEPESLGYTRDELKDALEFEGIKSRKYFYPPLHRQTPYLAFKPRTPLPVTDHVSDTMLSLPMYSHITKQDLDRIIRAVKRFSRSRRS